MRLTYFRLLFFVLLLATAGCDGRLSELFGARSISESTAPRTALTQATSNLNARKSYSYIVKSKTVAGEVMTEVEHLAPNRFLMRTNMPGANSEVIVVADESFSRVNGGKWTRDSGAGKMTAESLKSQMDFGNETEITAVELVGKEQVNGTDTLVYKFLTSKPYNMSLKVWVAQRTVLPLRTDAVGEFSGTRIETSTVYDYEKQFVIEKPEVFQ